LVVLEDFDGSFGDRFRLFQEIEKLLSSEPRRRLREAGFGTLIGPILLTKEEVGRHPPILVDILTDCMILYDKGDFINGHVTELQRRLEALRARKVRLPGGGWYWDLKPDHGLGVVVEI